MSEPKSESVSAAESTESKSESVPQENLETAAETSSPSKADTPSTQSEIEENETDNKPEESVPQSETDATDVKIDDKVSSEEELPKEEPTKTDPVESTPTCDTAERKQSSASDKQETKEPEKPVETDANDDLQNMIKELSEPRVDANSGQNNDKEQPGKETTENLISVLEDGIESQTTKEKPSIEPTSVNEEHAAAATTSTDANTTTKPPKPKKYLYKLKSKTGKILHYTSTVPITLKRPVIHLTKMADTSGTASRRDDIDSDNSSKENNLKENEAPNDNVMKVIRKKGRPPLSSRPPPVITLDGNASDTSEDMKSKSGASFSMQTRKRQLKFLPDGRLVTPQKRVRTDDKNQSASSSDSDIDVISDTEKANDATSTTKAPVLKKIEPATTSTAASTTPSVAPAIAISTSTPVTSIPSPKKFKPEMAKTNNSLTGEKRKYKKVFDYESYYREKTGIPSQSGLVRTPIGNRSFASNLTPIRKITDTPKLKPILPSNAGASKKNSSVDPAQLLSSLIGVPISSNQLNVVKFKPKIIQERTNTIIASTPKKVTFEDDRNTKYATANQSELLKSTPFKIVSKPTYQKILPKPTGVERTPITQSRLAYQPINIENKFASPVPASNSIYVASNSPFLRESLHDTLAKFESFTDSKIVKTKIGPKRAVKRKHDDDVYLKDNNTKTLYDLMYEIFEKMPSWNLHVVPDTNCFCIAQVSRGRMGIPTLKKSIEINSEFFAKVYVHQLQCKRYDGIYDTESKIVKLIKEIDALAA